MCRRREEVQWGTSSYQSTVLGRNEAKHAQWGEGMFGCFSHRTEPGYEFCKNIKGVVWFSCNDYATINNTNYIINYLKLEDSLDQTLAALKKVLLYTVDGS